MADGGPPLPEHLPSERESSGAIIRILIVNCHAAIVGGVEAHLQALLPALQGCGHQLAFLAEQAPKGIPSVLAEAPGVPLWVASSEDRPRLLRRVELWRPDVLYVHGVASPTLERALVTRYPSVLFAHVYHGTCISGSKLHEFPGYQPCERTFGPPCLLYYHLRRCGGLDPMTMLSLYATQAQRCRLLCRYRAVIVVSSRMAVEYDRHGVPSDRLHHLPYFAPGTEADASPPVSRPIRDEILFVGRLAAHKGVRLLIDACSRARVLLGRALTLRIVGDGLERPALETAARRARILAHFQGWCGTAERNQWLREADLLAVPSVWPEPFGLVGLEAGCVGLPAVGFAVGGIPDWLRAGVSGELAPSPPTAEGLAQAMVRALAVDSHWQRLRFGAWHLAQQFSLARHLETLKPILESAAR